MTDAYRPTQYIEYRDAAAAILAREPGDLAVAAFGLADLLAGAEPAEDLTPVYAFLEAHGFQVGMTTALARLGLVCSAGNRLDAAAPKALLGLPIGAGPFVAVPGMTAGAPVAVDRPGVGLVVAHGDGVRARAAAEPVADTYVTVLELDAAVAVVVLPEEAMVPLRAAMLARVQLGAAGELLGLCTRMLDDVIAYARLRRQFGRSISSFQVMQHLLGWAATERHQLASMYDIAVDRTLHDGPDPLLSATVKALAGRVAHTIAQTAIQVTGGISFTWEYSLNRRHQRVLALDQFAGSSADLIAAMGRRVRTEGTLPSLFRFGSAPGTTGR